MSVTEGGTENGAADNLKIKLITTRFVDVVVGIV
jgi:hypothetical protein